MVLGNFIVGIYMLNLGIFYGITNIWEFSYISPFVIPRESLEPTKGNHPFLSNNPNVLKIHGI